MHPPIESMRKGVYVLPNLLTSASLFCGFYSIINSFQQDFSHAAWAVILAMVFDGLDGKIARLTNTASRFGVEYDSLADVVSFGVAPGILIYLWALVPYGRTGWVGGFIFVLCAALRLARFNVQIETVEKRHFNGLPSPAAASMVAALVIFYDYLSWRVTQEIEHVGILVMTYCLALLMVSNIKYFSFKELDLFKRRPFSTFSLSLLVVVFIINEYHIAFFTLMFLYVISGPINFFIFSPVKTLRAMFQDR